MAQPISQVSSGASPAQEQVAITSNMVYSVEFIQHGQPNFRLRARGNIPAITSPNSVQIIHDIRNDASILFPSIPELTLQVVTLNITGGPLVYRAALFLTESLRVDTCTLLHVAALGDPAGDVEAALASVASAVTGGMMKLMSGDATLEQVKEICFKPTRGG